MGMLKYRDTSGNFVDLLFPVGFIYQSMNATSPANLFGGTWIQITNLFLRPSTSGGQQNLSGDEHVFTLNPSTSRATIGAVNNDIRSLGYIAKDVISYKTTVHNSTVVGQSYAGYVLSNMQVTAENRSFNHHTIVYGSTLPDDILPSYITCYTWYRSA